MSNYEFKLHIRRNGSWYISKPNETYVTKFYNFKDVVQYTSDFSRFIDKEIFKDSIICDRLDTGTTWGEIAEYIEACKFNEENSKSMISVYKDAQMWVDKYAANTALDILCADITNINRQIYSVSDTNNVEIERRKKYIKILNFLEIHKDFKKL